MEEWHQRWFWALQGLPLLPGADSVRALEEEWFQRLGPSLWFKPSQNAPSQCLRGGHHRMGCNQLSRGSVTTPTEVSESAMWQSTGLGPHPSRATGMGLQPGRVKGPRQRAAAEAELRQRVPVGPSCWATCGWKPEHPAKGGYSWTLRSVCPVRFWTYLEPDLFPLYLSLLEWECLSYACHNTVFWKVGVITHLVA